MSSAGASSATYRKVVNRIATTLRQPAKHTRYPSDDFEAVAGRIDPESRQRALEWYRRGIRRGFIEACDALLDGQLQLKGRTLHSPPSVVISMRVRFRGERWRQQRFDFSAAELDFK